MIYIKLTHVSGIDYINLDQVYRITQTSSTDLTFYDANSILPITYSFSSAQELTATLKKFESIIQSIDITSLATQVN
jgi:hypothetical protein